jgi:hypothetical protein
MTRAAKFTEVEAINFACSTCEDSGVFVSALVSLRRLRGGTTTGLAFRQIRTVTPANAVVKTMTEAGGTGLSPVPYSCVTY